MHLAPHLWRRRLCRCPSLSDYSWIARNKLERTLKSGYFTLVYVGDITKFETINLKRLYLYHGTSFCFDRSCKKFKYMFQIIDIMLRALA